MTASIFERPLFWISVAIALMVWLVFVLVAEEKEWVKYRDTHHCTLTHKEPDTLTTQIMYTGTNGSFIMMPQTIPGKEIWSCDGNTIKERN